MVDDLGAATAFFVELELKRLGEMPVEHDRVVGLEGVRANAPMLETADGMDGSS